MRQINFGVTLSLLLVTTLLLSSCSSFYKPEKQIVTVTKLVEKQIPIVPHPRQVQMNEIKIYVVSPEENFEQFKEEFEKKTKTIQRTHPCVATAERGQSAEESSA